jgi:hypothetical protein
MTLHLQFYDEIQNLWNNIHFLNVLIRNDLKDLNEVILGALNWAASPLTRK